MSETYVRESDLTRFRDGPTGLLRESELDVCERVGLCRRLLGEIHASALDMSDTGTIFAIARAWDAMDRVSIALARAGGGGVPG